MLCTARKAARPAEQKSPPAGCAPFRRLCRPGGLSRTQPGVSASRAWAALRQPVGHARQQSAFVGRHLRGGFAEIPLACLAHIIVSAAEIDGIHIQLQDLVLGILLLDGPCHERLGRLAREHLLLCEIQIFGKLLGDGAATLHKSARAHIVPQRTAQRNKIHAAMGIKTVVLHRHHSVPVQPGQLVQRRKIRLGAHLLRHFRQRLLLQSLPVHAIALQPHVQPRTEAKRKQQDKEPRQRPLDFSAHHRAPAFPLPAASSGFVPLL